MKLCNEKNDYFALNFKWLKLSNRSGSVVRGFLESVFDFFNKLRKNISLTIHSTEDFKVQNSTEAQFLVTKCLNGKLNNCTPTFLIYPVEGKLLIALERICKVTQVNKKVLLYIIYTLTPQLFNLVLSPI